MVRPIQIMRTWLSRRSPKARYRRQPGGYILATVIGLSLILAVGIASVSIHSAAERAGSLQSATISLSQSAAEIGIERLYAMLNNGPYQSLSTKSYPGTGTNSWSQEVQNINTAANQNSNTRNCGITPPVTSPQTLTSLTSGTTAVASSSNNIWWELKSYSPPNLTSNPRTPATVVMEGGAGTSSNDTSGRRTVIEKKFFPDNGQPILTNQAGNTALFAGSIDLGNNDVLSSDSAIGCANVFCKDCQTGQGPNSTVEGAVITLPASVPFPEPKVWPSTGATQANGFYDRKGQAQPFGTPPLLRVSDFPNTDANKFINIRVDNIPSNLKVINDSCGGAVSTPARLPVNSNSGCKRVAIYFEGNISGPITQIYADLPGATFLPYPENLVLYGLPSTSNVSQNITLSGNGDKIQGAVIVAPKARAGINGGPPKSRTNPDVYGPLYVGVWDRSNSNNAEIVVPYDMYDRIDDLIPNLNEITTLVALRNATSWQKGGNL